MSPNITTEIPLRGLTAPCHNCHVGKIHKKLADSLKCLIHCQGEEIVGRTTRKTASVNYYYVCSDIDQRGFVDIFIKHQMKGDY